MNKFGISCLLLLLIALKHCVTSIIIFISKKRSFAYEIV